MTVYIIKRLLLSLPVLFGITIITFAIIHLPSGGPTVLQSNMSAKVSADSAAKLRKLYDLDKPLHIQYVKWLGRLLKLDFGESFNDNRPVVEKIMERIPNTLLLNLLSLLIIFVVALPIGIYSAVKQNGIFDKTFSVITFLGYSLPAFWLALLLMLFFGVYLGVLPISGMRSPDSERFPLYLQLLDRVWHLILPVFVSAFGGLATISRYTKAAMLEIIRQDYIRTARAKGLSEHKVIFKHAFRNALLPIVTILGLSLPGLIGGGFIFETIFAWPGMGRLAYEASFSFDYTVIMGVVFFGAILTLLGNIIADITYALVDPRIRYK